MRRKGLIGTILATFFFIALVVILAAAFFVKKYYVIAGGQLFPRDQATLDLRGQAITPEEYDTLFWKLPKTEILWSVPFQGGYLSSDSDSLTLTHLSESDIPTLEYLPNLKTVDARSCTDYAALMKLYCSRPDLEVSFTLPIAGEPCAPDTKAITLSSLTEQDAALLALLPDLERVDCTLCREYDWIEQIRREHPSWEVISTTAIAGVEIDSGAKTLEVTGAQYTELFVGLAAMPELRSLTIHNPQTDGLSLVQLRQEYPNIDIHWDVEFSDRSFPDDATEVDISYAPIGSISSAKAFADYFPGLTKLIVDSAGIADEDMALYREDMRSSYKVVWTVYFTTLCKARTDETYFMPIKQGEYYFQEKHAYPLRYCEDMVCIDVGHSTISTIDFVAYMPHLKYLILAWTAVTDITPIANCKELIFLEVDNDIVHDLSPLVGCTALEDLNISNPQVSVSCEPISQMTWLKNLWMIYWSAGSVQRMREALPDTNVVTASEGATVSLGWRRLQNYFDMRDYLGMPYME